MSLTGNLEIFPMPEVLRLLSRSKKSGCLRVDAGETQGRVYLAGGAITFANTQSDDVVRQALINAGLVTDESLRLSKGSLPDALREGQDPTSITDFVRELVVESLYRVRKPGHGDFEFAVDVTPTYSSGQQFDAEVAVAESDRRASEWSDIFGTISDLDAPIRMVRDLPSDESVTVAPPTWRVLASLEGGASVRELAYRSGISEFQAARELAGLIRSELVMVVEAPVHESTYRAPVIGQTDQAPAATDADSSPEQEDFGSFFDTPSAEVTDEYREFEDDEPTDESRVDENLDSEDLHDENLDDAGSTWFDEAIAGSEVDEDPVSTEQQGDDDDESTSDGGWWAAAMGESEQESAGDPAADPDSFLESVFSQLNEDAPEGEETDEDETGFSMGLLRRRRMGTAARDITEG